MFETLKYKLLIAGDRTPLYEEIKKEFDNRGYDIFLAENIREYLDTLRNDDPDLIIFGKRDAVRFLSRRECSGVVTVDNAEEISNRCYRRLAPCHGQRHCEGVDISK